MKVLLEALLVVLAGCLLAWAANHFSPRGLVLTRNYFPAATVRPPAQATIIESTNLSASVITNTLPSATNSPTDSVLIELRDHGLQVTSREQAVQLFHDPRYQHGLIVFVDARNDQDYQAGHIPGAWQFDFYHPEKYLADVMGACQPAEQVVVYCHGGDCDDSVSAAMNLRDAGVLNTKLSVYAGGMAEWTTNQLPVEVGARNSGKLQEAKP